MLVHRGSNLWKEIKPFIKNLERFSFKTQHKIFLLKTTIPLRIKSLSITYNDISTL